MFGFFENIFCRENDFEIFNSVKSCRRDTVITYSTAFKKFLKFSNKEIIKVVWIDQIRLNIWPSELSLYKDLRPIGDVLNFWSL